MVDNAVLEYVMKPRDCFVMVVVNNAHPIKELNEVEEIVVLIYAQIIKSCFRMENVQNVHKTQRLLQTEDHVFQIHKDQDLSAKGGKG